MPSKVLMNQTSYQESKTIDLGSGTNFTCDLSQAQRFVVTLTGNAVMTLTQPVLMQDQEITLLVKCAVACTVTFPANCYNAAGALASFTFLPSGVVGAGGHALVGVVTSNGIFWDDGAVPASSLPDTALASKIVKDIGAPGVATLAVTGVSLVGQQIVLGAQTYTFATPHVAGDLNIDPDGATGAGNVAQTLAAIVATVNANVSRQFNAIEVGGDAIVFVERAIGGAALATTDTMGNGAFSHTTSMGFETAAVVSRSSGIYLVRANDVTAWIALDEVAIGGIASTTQPTRFTLQARASYDPTVAAAYRSIATLVTRVAQVNSNYWALLVQDPGAVLSANDGLVYEIEI